MQFQKGHENTGGRPKGSLNKTTDKTKQIILACSEKYSQEDFIKDMKLLKPYERLQVITRLWHIILPKNIELTGGLEMEGPKKIGFFKSEQKNE